MNEIGVQVGNIHWFIIIPLFRDKLCKSLNALTSRTCSFHSWLRWFDILNSREHSSTTASFLGSAGCQAVNQFKLPPLSQGTDNMPEQRYSANDRRKDFMINHNESDTHRPGIEPGSPDSVLHSTFWAYRTVSQLPITIRVRWYLFNSRLLLQLMICDTKKLLL
jgi:hypothetical protein